MSNIISMLSFFGKIALAGAVFSMVNVSNAQAGSRYSTPPATRLSSDLASPWIIQLGKRPIKRIEQPSATRPLVINPSRTHTKRKVLRTTLPRVRANTAAPAPVRSSRPQMSERFLPQTVTYRTKQKAGTVIISTADKYLYLVLGNGKARRYGVGVGRQGFTWSGVKKISRKAEWPGWTPPKEMIAREKKKGKILPAHMPGGPNNPLGARALYLGTSLYRIHGTTQPWTIGTNVSSGCIRMRNEDVIDFYQRVKVGTKVIVI